MERAKGGAKVPRAERSAERRIPERSGAERALRNGGAPLCQPSLCPQGTERSGAERSGAKDRAGLRSVPQSGALSRQILRSALSPGDRAERRICPQILRSAPLRSALSPGTERSGAERDFQKSFALRSALSHFTERSGAERDFQKKDRAERSGALPSRSGAERRSRDRAKAERTRSALRSVSFAPLRSAICCLEKYYNP